MVLPPAFFIIIHHLIGNFKCENHFLTFYIFDGSGTHNFPYHFCEQIGKEIRDVSDEIPFEIPDGWEWCRWGELSESIQYGYNAPAKENGRIKMVRISDIQDNRVLWESVPYCDIEEKIISTYLLRPNDILFARTGGTVGKSYLVKSVPEQAIYAGYLIRTRYSNSLCPEYLKFFMESELYWTQLRSGTIATAQPNCNGKALSNMLVPVPPLAEQHRIVAKIEELLPYIEQYEQAETKLAKLNADFPEALKKSILQEAVQGRLVPQNPDDEPASILLERIKAEKQALIKAGKIKKSKHESTIVTLDKIPYEISDGKERCIAHEVPFEIPESWCWCRLNDIALKEIRRGKSPVYAEKSSILVFAQKCNVKLGGINISLAKCLSESAISKYPQEEYMQDSDIIVNSTGTGTLGRIGFYTNDDNPNDIPIVPDSHVTIVRVDKAISRYIYYVLKYYQPILEKAGEGSTKQKELKPDRIKELFIPLPPLDEQNRIVDTIIKAYNVCEML